CGSALFSRLQSLEDRDRLPWAHLHDRLLPLAGTAVGVAPPPGLALFEHGPDLHHPVVGQLLARLSGLRLVRALVHAERVLAVLRKDERLLGDDRSDDPLARVHHAPPSAEEDPAARATSAGNAASETSSDAAPITSATPASAMGITSTRLM